MNFTESVFFSFIDDRMRVFCGLVGFVVTISGCHFDFDVVPLFRLIFHCILWSNNVVGFFDLIACPGLGF